MARYRYGPVQIPTTHLLDFEISSAVDNELMVFDDTKSKFTNDPLPNELRVNLVNLGNEEQV